MVQSILWLKCILRTPIHPTKGDKPAFTPKGWITLLKGEGWEGCIEIGWMEDESHLRVNEKRLKSGIKNES